MLEAKFWGGDGDNLTNLGEKFKRLIEQNASPERVCTELSRFLQVQPDAVGLLRLQNNALSFVFPSRLKTAGTIPLSSSAVAARTASTKTTMLSNNFVKVRHASVFEGIKLENASDGEIPVPIQKLMSVPVFGESQSVLGVVQISRKGEDVAKAGPDFTHDDLRHLEEIATLIAKFSWMRDGKEPGKASVERV